MRLCWTDGLDVRKDAGCVCSYLTAVEVILCVFFKGTNKLAVYNTREKGKVDNRRKKEREMPCTKKSFIYTMNTILMWNFKLKTFQMGQMSIVTSKRQTVAAFISEWADVHLHTQHTGYIASSIQPILLLLFCCQCNVQGTYHKETRLTWYSGQGAFSIRYLSLALFTHRRKCTLDHLALLY